MKVKKTKSTKKHRNNMSLLSEHLEQGALCPFCGGFDIEGGSLDVIGNETMQDCSCLGCGKAWRDTYVLSYCCELEK